MPLHAVVPRLLVLALIVVGAGFGPLSARAAPKKAKPVPWYEAMTVNGFVSASYGYNFNRPASRTNPLRVFDLDDDTFKLDVLELVAQRTVSKPRDGGFRADLALGSSVPRVSSSLGLFRTETTTEDLDLQQAFLSYLAPLGSGLRFDAGKFITPFGYEVIEGYDGWNDNATRSILFGYAIPFTHTGVRASYTFSPRVSATALVVNGCDLARDNNRSKSLGGQVTVAPSPGLTLLIGGMIGPEQSNNDSNDRALVDVVAIFRPEARTTFGFNADWASEAGLAGPGSTSRWSGYAAYLRQDTGRGFAMTLRAETFRDFAGRAGLTSELSEFTLTPELRLTPQLLVRADLRVDRAAEAVFPREEGGLEKSQPTVLLNLLGSF